MPLLHFIRASILTEAIIIIPEANEKFEILAETALDWAFIHWSGKKQESVFNLALSTFAKLGEIPDKELYEVVMK